MATDLMPRPARDEARVLLLPPTTRDAEAIRTLLAQAEITCVVCANMIALCQAVREGSGAVIVSEESIIADHAGIAACVREQPVWSDLPILVLSRSGVEAPMLSAALARLGNVSVLERPVRVTTLISLVRSALRARERQYQVREHLADLALAGQALRASEQRYRLLVENIKDYAIFMTDPTGLVTSWNSGAQQILGYSEAQIVGQSVEVFFTPEDRAAGVPQREMAMAREHGRSMDIRWHVRQGGERFYVDGVLTAVLDDTGHLIGYSKLMRDVTERNRIETERERLFDAERIARAEAERAGRMKDEFLATLSHELRTPLNAIVGWAQILKASPFDSKDVKEGMEIIERNARAQAQIVEDLLDMSRIISAKVRLDVQRVDLVNVLESAVQTVRPAANAKGVRLHMVLDPDAGPVAADPNRLQQVFWNLLTNAVKFTPKGGQVQILLERVHSQIEVSIIDTGEGIAPEFLPHVFDRFRQADASTTRRHGGLGLGLAIVKHLVELHGGTIRADSPGLRLGSTFTVSLPVTPVHTEPAPVGERRHPSSALMPVAADACAQIDGVRVLVVDDEPDSRSLLQRLLEDCRAVVSTASSSAEAFERLIGERPDVLVSDIGLPVEDGYTLIRRVRALTPDQGGRTPAIALTAYARPEDRMKAIMAGFQHHVSKPVEPAELITMVASVVESKATS